MTRTSLLFAGALALLTTATAGYELRPLKGPRADVAALLLVGGESGTLRTTGLARSPCAMTSGGRAARERLPAWLGVEIEGQSLLDAVAAHDETDVPESVRLELYVYVMNRGGEIVDSRNLWTRIPLSEIVGRLPGGGILLFQDFELPVGEYQLRTLVREPRSQQFSLRILGLTVHKGLDSTPAVSPPVFLEEETSWLVAGNDVNGVFPSALPVLVAGTPRQFALQGCHLAASTVEVRLLTREHQSVPGVRIEISPAEDDDFGETTSAEIEVQSVQPGLYLLEAVVSGSGSSSTQTLPVFVTASENVTTWADLSRLPGTTETTVESPAVEEAGSGSKRIRALEAAYLRTLELLAAGRLEDATTSLANLEKRAVESLPNKRKAIKQLTEAQNRVTASILRHETECLLPILQLHLELRKRYAASGEANSQLLHATRNRIRSLAQVYATDAKQELAPQLSASVLAELATRLAESGYLTSALIVLREALSLDAQNTDVVLDLAYQYEHHGFWDEALDLLDRLIELEPRSDEGRLRLAMLLLRLDRDGEAYPILRRLIGDARSEWVLAIAYQELGHSLLRQEQFNQAAVLLEQAVRRLPNNQRLRIELSYALDRVGRRHDARAVVEDLPRADSTSSPRLNYRVPSRGGTRISRADLLRHSTARLPLLAAALDTVETSK